MFRLCKDRTNRNILFGFSDNLVFFNSATPTYRQLIRIFADMKRISLGVAQGGRDEGRKDV